MTRSLLLAIAASALLLGCPKAAPTTVAGTDDEKMDMLASQLEEYRTRTDLQCTDTCELKAKVCGLSETACEIAGRSADRADFQKRCVTAQEECARFNEACASCAK